MGDYEYRDLNGYKKASFAHCWLTANVASRKSLEQFSLRS